ncbi:glycoside hydrolase family 30 protein [Limisphaera ngatamarikiensis]|uniref:Glycoside hydrolase family 30 protein n=1 Tax=Limisphaera ngatamarikiensis TaxID=1324935 RepID=A0A6M1RTD2_9BACT|nr:glycoside hydrolase family 30 protein [Limisphaera ngatamarikiensis]NGO38032.1 glycoside hydrolase family 30 protein [Limisphaera ngatamarikiensis]
MWVANPAESFQPIEGFGASDAWAAQFVGRWPEETRQQVARLLFSREFDPAGRPRGIGLSIWRFNIGAGSAEQGADSGIRDPWRRAECFQNAQGYWDWSKQAGQQWFLEAARRHGVETVVAFVNSPPVHLTRNGRAWGDGSEHSNLAPERYAAFAEFLATVCEHFEKAGLPFDYLSPINEPQWRWSRRNGQEGCPWTNEEIRALVPVLGRALQTRGLKVRLVLPEAAQLLHLLGPTEGEPLCSDQLRELFGDRSDALLRTPAVAPVVAAHGYGTTTSRTQLRRVRQDLGERLRTDHPRLRYWMSEYCILDENDGGRLRGPGRDLGIEPALFVAEVIHQDLVLAWATSWQWWLAISPYDYKDGLVYVDRNPAGGRVYESKLLWAVGHYARFVRPGAVRIHVQVDPAGARLPDESGPWISGFRHPRSGTYTFVALNRTDREVPVILRMADGSRLRFRSYLTTPEPDVNLQPGPLMETGRAWTLPARSMVTWVSEL